MAILKFSPLDKEGIRFDRPTHEVIWQKLTNCLFKDGSLVPRPGFGPVYELGSDDFSALGVELGPPVFIGQIRNPGSTSTGREGYSILSETVRPDSSASVVAGWTAQTGPALYQDIDETPPDAVDVISSSTIGSIFKVGFAAASNTYSTIFGVLLRGRAKVTEQDAIAKLKFYSDGTTQDATTLMGEAEITGTGSEADPWIEFAIPMAATNENSALPCNPFDDSSIDSLECAVKLDTTGVRTTESLGPDANGNYTSWKDASDDGTGVYTDLEDLDYFWFKTLYDPYFSNPNSKHFLKPSSSGTGVNGGAGNKHSFGFTSGITWDSISAITFTGYVTKGTATEPQISLYWRSLAGTETLVTTFAGELGQEKMLMATTMSTNPGGGAWTGADFNAGEFFLNCVTGGEFTKLLSIRVDIAGIKTGTETVKIDYLALDIAGAISTSPGIGIPDYDRLWSTKSLHFRLDTDGHSAGGAPVTNITNAVGLTSPPNIPVDWDILYGQVYMVNGKDATRVYPNGTDLYTSLTANGASGNKMTGRTVAAFANRIWYGWVTDNTTVTPERVSYSKFNDGSTHNHISAGDLDVLDTPGGVVKLIQLNEDVLACLKEEGIYNFIKTGQAAFPVRRDVIDPQTGCLAKMTAKRVVLANGQAVIIFLGLNPTKGGMNVFMFDGAQVVPVGNAIVRKLEEESNPNVIQYAFAEIDPLTGTYWLFFAEGCSNLFPDSAYVMDVNTLAWTRAEFPFFVSCAGHWNLFKLDDYTVSTAGARKLNGERRLVLGNKTSIPFDARHGFAVDVLKGSTADNSSFGNSGQFRIPVISVIETGDLVRPSDVQVVSYKLHVSLTLRSYGLRIVVSSSEDGGQTFNTEQTYFADPENFTLGEKKYMMLDLTPSHANQVRYKFEIGPDTDLDIMNRNPPDSDWQIDDIRIELIGAGDGA